MTAPRGGLLGRSRRLRSKRQLQHTPNGRSKGKWHSLRALWKYKLKAKKANKVAAASRRRNAR